ncbi:MAG TPA: right-handed parallel beta-helix repeat-containing protein [Dissulfurispiraceae bacterium]|nr:right-handed parallel beta-helix repeat-containing protein [Dissulfurispiraceae bacterium]
MRVDNLRLNNTIAHRYCPAVVTFMLAVMISQVALAATFNVSNLTEFNNALIVARNNGEDDMIVMAAGTYNCDGSVSMLENHSLTIQGAGTGKTIIKSNFGLTSWLSADAATQFTIKGVTIQDSTGDGAGQPGLDFFVDQANISIEDCEFKNNVSNADGTGLNIHATGTSTVIVRNNVFSNNTQTGLGQGAGAHISSYGPITIENNTFSGNRSQSSGGGLVAFADVSSQITLKGNTFISNIARNDAGDQGMGGGASVVSTNGTVIMVNNIFYDNSAQQSGAAQIQSSGSSDITVVNNTFFKNSAQQFGGLFVWPKTGTTNIYNNILYANSDTLGSYDLAINNSQSTLVNVYNNDVKLWAASLPAFAQQDGNINEDPKLNDLWHLIKDSPCIDTGLSSAPSLSTVDIDSNPRIINGSVDIGAAEYTGTEVKLVREGATVGSYANLQDAYEHADSGDVIKMPATVLTEDLTFFRPVNVEITGGYKYDYVQSAGMTTLYGSMTIQGGGTVGCGWFTLK